MTKNHPLCVKSACKTWQQRHAVTSTRRHSGENTALSFFHSGRVGLPTFHATDAFDPVSHLHVVALEWHEDSVRVVGLPLRVHLGVAVLELKALVAVVLHHFAVDLKVFLHPAEGQEDLRALSSALDGRLVVDQAVDLLVLEAAGAGPDHGRRLRGLRRVLLAADAGVAHLGTRRGQGGARQEAEGGVTGAAVP